MYRAVDQDGQVIGVDFPAATAILDTQLVRMTRQDQQRIAQMVTELAAE